MLPIVFVASLISSFASLSLVWPGRSGPWRGEWLWSWEARWPRRQGGRRGRTHDTHAATLNR